MSTEELALTWDDHHTTLVGVFKKLLETSTLVDCTIAAEGRYLRAHKIVLSACSPYFEMLFSQENEKNPIVVLKDIKFQELQAMIDFIYSGKVKVPEDRLGDFVDAAESLQIKGLGSDNYQMNNSGKERLSHLATRKEDCVSPVPHKRSRQTFLSANAESVGEISSATNVSENMNNENMLHQPQVDILDSPSELSSCIASTTSCSAAFSASVLSNQISSSPLETALPISETVVVKTEPEPIAEVYLPDFKPKDEEGAEDILGLDSGGDATESGVDVNSQHASNQFSDMEYVPHFNMFEEEIPDDILEKGSAASLDLLPERTKIRYEKEYQDFQHWRQCNNIGIIDEAVMLAYAKERSDSYSPTSLWTKFSMLKLAVRVHENVDISRFGKLYIFLRQRSEGYIPKKAKILSEEQIRTFLLEANDYVWLLVKVILIFGIFGACRRDELVSLTIDDIENSSHGVLVTLKSTKTKKNRIFVIPKDGLPFNAYELITKYAALRPSNLETRRFFIGYKDGKCTNQVVGIHSIGNAPRKVAEFLKLDTPELYTGHCFRRSSATMMSKTVAIFSGWKSTEGGIPRQ